MFSVGLFDLLFGALMLILLHFKVYRKFSTFLELDYDTPWDNRHISRDMKLRLRLTKDATPVRKSIRRLKDSLWRTSHSSDVPLVDAVSDVITLTPSQLRPVPPFNSMIASDHILALGAVEDRMLILIDIEKLMTSQEMGLITDPPE